MQTKCLPLGRKEQDGICLKVLRLIEKVTDAVDTSFLALRAVALVERFQDMGERGASFGAEHMIWIWK